MFFHSQHYLLFFAVVFTLYWSIPNRFQKARVYLLLAASYFFYATWSQWLAFLIAATTVADYLIARGMDATGRILLRKLLLTLSLVMNLGLLCYFKYANFFLEELQKALLPATGGNWCLLEVILPFGISFYTFEAISYTFDVYRGKIRAERSLPNFMLFILFFPHLVAGPIVRGGDFLPQTHRPKRWSWLRMQLGVQFFLMGLFKKMAIADRMAIFADPVFQNPEQYNTGAVWIGVFAYAIQIYCDFSGYSDMAVGSAHMLGYKLTLNFDMPYLSANVQEFWRRWHISLSSWLRDYLYIGTLGGSRGGYWRTQFNLLATMTLGGLWHGANWTFVVWGVAHGLLLGAHRDFKDVCKRRPRLDAALQSAGGRLLCVFATFMAVMFLWVFFRAQDFSTAATIFQRMFTNCSGLGTPLHNRSLWYLVAVLGVGHLLGSTGLWKRWAPRLPAPAMGLGYAAALTFALLLAPDASKAFIYFTF